MHRARISLPDHDGARTVGALLEESVDRAPLAVTLFEATGSGWTVDAYYEGAIAPAEVATILTSVSPTPDISVEPVPDENWVAISQAGLPPVAAGRFLVHGSHDRATGREHRDAIEIDAGEAFGTAHHASTLGCLLAIDRLTRRRRYARVLDLGCGSGVLAIAAARVLPDASIIASDFDPEAIRVAAENARKNALAHRIRPVVALGLAHPAIRSRAPFDLVIANILAEPLIALAPGIARIAAPGGSIVLSGIIPSQAAAVAAAYAAAGFVRCSQHLLNGWIILTLERHPRRRLRVARQCDA